MGGSSSATRPGVSRFPARWQWVSLALGTGSSCEPDEARGSQRREAYSLYVERRGRPSNEVWRRKLTQYPLPRDPGDGCGAADPLVAAVGERLDVHVGYEQVIGSPIREWVQDILRHGMPHDVTAAARGLDGW